MTYFFDANILYYKLQFFFAYSYGKINDYLICQKIYLLEVVKEFTDVRYGINGLRCASS